MRCADEIDLFLAIGHFRFTSGEHTLFFSHGFGARLIGEGLRLGLGLGLLGDGDGAVLLRQFDRGAAFDFRPLLTVAVKARAALVRSMSQGGNRLPDEFEND